MHKHVASKACHRLLDVADDLEAALWAIPQMHRPFVQSSHRALRELLAIAEYETAKHMTPQQCQHLCALRDGLYRLRNYVRRCSRD